MQDNPSELRYELLLNGRRIGEIRYRREADAVALVHTEIDPAHQGQGLATHLIEEVLRDLRERDLRVIPICPLVTSYLRSHPEAANLAADPALPE